MATATYEICVDWNNDGDFADAYDDITADVKSIHFSRGKSDELGKAEVGQLSITLNNADAKYTPGAGGVISALLLPKRPIRVRATYAAVTYNCFYGFIEEIIPHPHLSEQDCIITAVDGLDFLSRHDMGSILVKDQLTGYLQKETLFDAGWPNGGIITDDLVFNAPLWQYDLRGSPFTSYDSYRHLCTVTGALWTPQGRKFDGIDDFISLGNPAQLINVTAQTLLMWLRIDLMDIGQIYWYGSLFDGTFGDLIRMDTGPTKLQVIVKNTAGTQVTLVSVTPVLGQWYQVGYSWDGTNAFGVVDGVSQGTIAFSGTLARATVPINIGARSAVSSWSTCLIGEVTGYSRGSSLAEIPHNYQATKWFYETNIDAGQDTVPYWYGADVRARFAQEEIDDSEQGFSLIDGVGNFRFEDRHHRSTATHQTSQGTFNNTMANITYSLNPKNVYNIIKATVTPWTLITPAVELWKLQETPSIPVGEIYTVWGESQYFVDAWTALDGTDYTISGTFTIAQTNFAKSIKIVITNTGTIPNAITLLRARGTYYDDQTKVTRKAIDTTSQTAYQKRTLSLDGKYMTDAGKAQSFCNYAIGKYKDPRAELSMTIMNQDAATLTQILSREISDRITVVNTKLGVNGDYFIDYMEHNISQSGLSHTATYRLADTINEDFWCLGFSKLGTQTKLGY